MRKPREAVHRDGEWHRVFHLWVVRSDGRVLLQRRSRFKAVAPGKVDVTVGGHLRAGETAFDAVREVEEEIGLRVEPVRLALLGNWRTELVAEGLVDREHAEVFALVDDGPLEEFRLDCQEVYLLYEAPLEGLIALYRDGRPLPVPGFDCQRRRNDALLIGDDLIGGAREVTVQQLEALRAWMEESAAG